MGVKRGNDVPDRTSETSRTLERIQRFVETPANLDWFLLNPVIKGYISYSDLKNGTLTLWDLFLMNDMIDYHNRVEEEIEFEVRKNNGS